MTKRKREKEKKIKETQKTENIDGKLKNTGKKKKNG